MRKLSLMAAVLFLAILLAGQAVLADEVTATVETVTIPTFEMEPGDPSPAVFETSEWYRAYPRSVLRVYTREDEPVDREYEMAVLENSHLRVEVLPAVGGRIWRIIDKKTGRNLLWTNDAILPIRVGRRRGWLAGGIEFPFPVGNHGQDTMEPYRYRMLERDDGSASVIVAAFDHFYRFRSSYEISLAPDEARMGLTVRLYNPTEVRNRYQIWINAAVNTGDDMQFIFPVEYVAGHGFGGVHKWPMMDGDVDKSYYKNSPRSMGVFGWDVDFFGAYWHDEDYGLIRYSPKESTRGIKLWTWGTGSHWTDEYSIDQGPYNEIQGGRWANQSTNGLLEPHQMDTWTEYWYPVRGLGGVDAATKDAALRMVVPGGDKEAIVKLNVMRPVKGRLVAEVDDKVIFSAKVDGVAGELLEFEIDMGDAGKGSTLVVRLIDETNFTLVSHEIDISGHEVKPPEPEVPKSIDLAGEGPSWDALEDALHLEVNEGNLPEAVNAYRRIVSKDPSFAAGWKALGILLYKQMDLEGAGAALAKAVEAGPSDPEALYYLGVVKLAAGEPDALATLEGVDGDIIFTHAAKVLVARETLKRGEYEAAIGLLLEAGKGFSDDVILWDTLAVAARLAGKDDIAAEARAAALAADPADPIASVEALFADDVFYALDAIRQALGTDDDLYIEVALFYNALDLDCEALRVIKAGSPLTRSPIYHYYNAWLLYKFGNDDEVDELVDKAKEMGTDYAFPHRREAIVAMDRFARLAGGTLTQYHKGTYLYWLGRQDEALALWEGLLGDAPIAGLYKSVATAYSQGKLSSDIAKSIELYRKALEADPEDVAIYHELDDLYEIADDWGAKRRSLREAREKFPEDDQIALRMALAHCDRRRFTSAMEILESHSFKRAHQSGQLWRLAYEAITRTYGGVAADALDDGDEEKALRFLAKAAAARETIRKWFD